MDPPKSTSKAQTTQRPSPIPRIQYLDGAGNRRGIMGAERRPGADFKVAGTSPPGGGVCLYEGRIKELAAQLPKINVSAVLTSFPRPNQAFWTLSALWSGWLWGPEALEHFKSVLRRRRYDWGWHANAIQGALESLASDLPDGTPYFGLINEVEPGFLSAVLLGSQLSNLKLCGAALRTEDDQAQILWRHSKAQVRTNQIWEGDPKNPQPGCSPLSPKGKRRTESLFLFARRSPGWVSIKAPARYKILHRAKLSARLGQIFNKLSHFEMVSCNSKAVTNHWKSVSSGSGILTWRSCRSLIGWRWPW